MPDDDDRSLGQTVSDSKRQERTGAVKRGLGAASSGLSQTSRDMTDSARAETSSRIGPVQYHRGGLVRKTGPARLKKGERVVPRGKAKRAERMMKRNKMKMRSGRR